MSAESDLRALLADDTASDWDEIACEWVAANATRVLALLDAAQALNERLLSKQTDPDSQALAAAVDRLTGETT